MDNKNFRTLIVEDQKNIADDIKKELQTYSEVVSVSGSVARGLLRAKAYSYNLFVVNCGHDGKQGEIFVSKLKEQQDLTDVPFLFTYKHGARFCTSLSNLDIKFDAFRLPFDKNEFQWRFRRLTGLQNENIEEEDQGIGKVLLTEDNPLNQKVLGMFISKLGFEYDVASNGESALELCSKNQYKYILMDIFMPGMDGTEVSKRIREMEKEGTHTAKIIAISANESEEGIKSYYDSGMNDYLVKPFTLEGLREKLM